MKKHYGRFLVYGILLAAPASLALAHPSWMERRGFDFWNVGELESQIEQGEATYEELDRETQAILERIESKEDIVFDLIYGEIDLLEAARRFRNLGCDRPLQLALLHDRFPGSTDDECICRNVLEYAEHLQSDRPELASAVTAIQRQFHALRNRPGGIRLG